MNVRKATVMEGGMAQPLDAVELRFRGLWLRRAGFEAGRRVLVTNPSPGVLELRVECDCRPDAVFSEAMARLDRAALVTSGFAAMRSACE